MTARIPHFMGYKPLDIQSKEIRLMLLEPCRDSSARITCKLVQVPLQQANPFCALSYVWGDPDDTEKISLDGESVLIRKNLWQCLHSLRGFKESRRTWVDYICIDQQNIAERNSQVSMMAEIYREAEVTFAWLGEATPDSEKAFHYLKMPQNQASRRCSTSERIKKCKYIADLVNRAYWDRTWIVQEAALSRVLRLVAGKRVIEFETLKPWLIFNGRHGKSIAVAVKLRQRRIQTWKLVSEIREQKSPLPLSKLVSALHSSQCHDPRDKIFGLVSLTYSATRSSIAIDYDKTSLQIFLDAYELWTWAQSPSLLHESGKPLYSDKTRDLPQSFAHMYRQHSHTLDSDLTLWRQGVSCDVPSFKPIYMVGECWVARTTFFTIAIVNGGQSLQIADRSDPTISSATAFVSVVVIESDRPLCDAIHLIIFTNVLPRDGDMLVSVGRVCLLVRRVNGNACMTSGCGLQMPFSSLSLPEPVAWSKSQIPGKEFKVEQWPQTVVDDHNDGRMDTGWFNVSFNASAIVDVIQTELIFNNPLAENKKTWSFLSFMEKHGLSAGPSFWSTVAKEKDLSRQGVNVAARLPRATTGYLEALHKSP